MKLLLDENLSHRLVSALQPAFPGSSLAARGVRLVLGNCRNAQVLDALVANVQPIEDAAGPLSQAWESVF